MKLFEIWIQCRKLNQIKTNSINYQIDSGNETKPPSYHISKAGFELGLSWLLAGWINPNFINKMNFFNLFDSIWLMKPTASNKPASSASCSHVCCGFNLRFISLKIELKAFIAPKHSAFNQSEMKPQMNRNQT